MAQFTAATRCFLLCPRSFGRAHFKQTHTETSNSPWAKVPVQTDKMHRPAFTDVLESLDKLVCTLTLTKTIPILCLLCSLCVTLKSHLRLTPLRKRKTRPSKLSVCYITSCNLYFSAELGRPALNQHECFWRQYDDTEERTTWQAVPNKPLKSLGSENDANKLVNCPVQNQNLSPRAPGHPQICMSLH